MRDSMRDSMREAMRESVHGVQRRVLRRIEALVARAMPPPAQEDPFAVFHAPNALAINRARQEHLGSLGLDLSGKKVLEVGAGIGLHTPFFLDRGCEMVVTDGRRENVDEAARRLPPRVRTQVFDVEREEAAPLGRFDVVYCYGLLYHLGDPERALARLAAVCDTLLLETAVSPGAHDELLLVRDPVSHNQAVSGVGCRPTRLWVLRKLKALLGHGYIARTQPDHIDFPSDWKQPPTQLMYRSIFVGSRMPLELDTLTDVVPDFQATYRAPSVRVTETRREA